MKFLQRVNELFFLIGCSLIFNIPAFLNGFPLVTSDSGTYMASGFRPFIPFDRPVMYGLFVRHMSLKESLWFVVIIQGILVAWILSQVIKQFLPQYGARFYRFMLFILLSLISTLTWYCSQIMADVFAALPALGIALLLFAPNQNRAQKIFTALIVIFSCLTHNSHLVANTLLIVTLFVLAISKKYFNKEIFSGRRFLLVTIIIVSAWLIGPFINYLIDGKFRQSGSAHVFLAARFAESGILQDYLDKNCPGQNQAELNDTSQYLLMTKHSKKFLDIESASLSDSAKLHQWTYLNGANQKFHLIKIDNGLYKIIVVHSKKALSVLYEPQWGTNSIVQAADTGGPGQKFRLIHKKNNYYAIESAANNEVLDIREVSRDNGAYVHLYKNLDADNQLFQIIPQNSNTLFFLQSEIPPTAVDFIWPENSILTRTGSWEESKDSYTEVINGILLSPKYFLWNLRESITSTCRQLVRFDVGNGVFPYGENSSPTINLKAFFKKDFNAYSNSFQNLFGTNFTDVNKRIYFFMILSSLILVIFFWKTENFQNRRGLWLLCVVCILSVVINAFVNGTLANVIDRLQSRIVWLIPFCALMIIFPAVMNLFKKLKQNFQ